MNHQKRKVALEWWETISLSIQVELINFHQIRPYLLDLDDITTLTTREIELVYNKVHVE